MVVPNTGPGIGRWGDHRQPLPESMQALLHDIIGPGSPAWGGATEPPMPGRLDAAAAQAIQALGSRVTRQDDDRVKASRGMAFVDVVGARKSQIADAVVTPDDGDAVQRVIDWCREHAIAVVPRGGGTSVVGGLVGPQVPWVILDTAALTDIDEPRDAMVRVGSGVTGPQLEAFLGERGWVFGHLPQSWERATMGGYAATRSAGQNSTGYGRMEDLVAKATLATPIGRWRVGSVPASAVGPNLLSIVLGSEGTLGVLTDLHLRIRPKPDMQVAEGVLAPDWSAGVAAVEALAVNGLTPAVLRLSDAEETDITLRTSPRILRQYAAFRRVRHGCLLIMDWHGTAAQVAAQRHEAWSVLREHRFVRLGGQVGRAWRRQRFHGPYLRDQLIEAGYFVETFETAAPWHRLQEAHIALTQTVRQRNPKAYVMAHISHVYPTGASLYFTVVARGDFVHDWPEVKRIVTDAIRSLHLTASHHHGVGVDHAPWFADEVGPVGRAVLHGLKHTLDPTNIMNPALWTAPQ